ncbi:hypothetical protein Tco_1364046 [Tanacetum coccineum]
MLLEWGRFVPAVKLNKGLKTSNYDQLYAYLKQHEAHVNENKMMLERYSQHAIDPLALVSNVSPQQYPTQSSAIPQSAYVPPVSYQPQFADNTQLDSEYFKEKMLLMQAQENGVVLDEEQLLFIAGGQDNAFDTYVDEPLTMFIAILSVADPIYDEAGLSYDSNILSEVQDHDNCQDIVGEYHEVNEMQKDNKVVNESLTAELARYKEQVELYEKRASAMQVQSALYNGHEIVKTNHAPAVVHDSEDTLELSEITRKIMLEKVKIPLCVEKRVKIAPPDYSKDNYLATFTPQRHLNRYFSP